MNKLCEVFNITEVDQINSKRTISILQLRVCEEKLIKNKCKYNLLISSVK